MSFEGPVATAAAHHAPLYREGIGSMKAILAQLALTIGGAVSAAAEPLVSPDVLIADASVSSSPLHHKKIVDDEPEWRVMRRRIERAQEMLLRTGISLVDVAPSVGFQTQSHFTSVFNRYPGQPPRAWRESVAYRPDREAGKIRGTALVRTPADADCTQQAVLDTRKGGRGTDRISSSSGRAREIKHS
jgi:AraC-like DNA-binding protein